jgi:hypothetical protein
MSPETGVSPHLGKVPAYPFPPKAIVEDLVIDPNERTKLRFYESPRGGRRLMFSQSPDPIYDYPDWHRGYQALRFRISQGELAPLRQWSDQVIAIKRILHAYNNPSPNRPPISDAAALYYLDAYDVAVLRAIGTRNIMWGIVGARPPRYMSPDGVGLTEAASKRVLLDYHKTVLQWHADNHPWWVFWV